MKKLCSLLINMLLQIRIFAPLALISVMFLPAPSYALPVQGLYQEEIAVTNQGEQERRRAYTEAFARVITKVTGERRWLQHPEVAAAIRGADRYVAEVSFRSSGVVGQQGGLLDVRFDRPMIDSLLNQGNIPVWDNNRASILLWLTVQDTDGRRVMLGSSAEHTLLDQVRQFADERAVPVLIPILDLEDHRLVTPAQAWALDTEALGRAADRYAADSVLAGRVLVTPAGELVGFWQLVFRDDVQIFDHIGMLDTYMDLPLDRASTRLASHFGLVPSEFEREDQVSIRVDGVSDLESHTQLIRYLEGLSVVQQVQVSALRPEGLDLNLRLLGSQQIFVDFVSLGRDLQPVNLQPGQAASDQLHYRWTR
jgi:hypothetical protein